MTKRPAPRAPEQTRNKLLTAAAKSFNTVGYFGTDSNRIARAAGYAPGTFYVHFPDKLAIFLEVYRWWGDLEWQAIAAAVTPSAEATSETTRIASAVLKHHCEWRTFRASLRALTATDERVHEARIDQRKRQIGQVAELLGARGIRRAGARIYQSLLLFEALCDAVADGDAAALGIKERDIVALLAADVAALLGSADE